MTAGTVQRKVQLGIQLRMTVNYEEIITKSLSHMQGEK